jgi:hypothetical protein
VTRTPARRAGDGFARVFAKGRRHGKYNNVKTEIDGITFDSKKEAAHYLQLQLLLRAGVIRDLRLQVPFVLAVNGVKVCTYRADFVYREKDKSRRWVEVVCDVKGVRTPTYNLKKKLMKAIRGISILEV